MRHLLLRALALLGVLAAPHPALAQAVFVEERRDLGPGIGPAISPDGTQVVYYRWSQEEGSQHLLLALEEGASPQVVLGDTLAYARGSGRHWDHQVTRQLAQGPWGPEGRRLALLARLDADGDGRWEEKEGVRLMLLALPDGEPRVVDEGRWIHSCFAGDTLHWARTVKTGGAYHTAIRTELPDGEVRTLRESTDAAIEALAASADGVWLAARLSTLDPPASQVLVFREGALAHDLPSAPLPPHFSALAFHDGALIRLEVEGQEMVYQRLDLQSGTSSQLATEPGRGRADSMIELPPSPLVLLANPLRLLLADPATPDRWHPATTYFEREGESLEGEHLLFFVRGGLVGYARYHEADGQQHVHLGQLSD